MKMRKPRARESGIRNVMEFPSGAALLPIEKNKAEEAVKKIEEAGLQRKSPVTPQGSSSFRVHDIPSDCSMEDVQDNIRAALGYNPSKVILVRYKERRNVQMAVVEGPAELMETAITRRTIFRI